MYCDDLGHVLRWIWKIYSDNFEDVQKKDLRMSSEEGLTKTFRRSINDDVQRKDQPRCLEEGLMLSHCA
eukprot:9407286-Karenia_brevis.AAC.1